MRQSCLLLLALALAGCTSSAAQQLQREPDAQLLTFRAKESANVGKDYWLTDEVPFCPEPVPSTKCTLLTPPAVKHIKIDGIERDLRGGAVGDYVHWYGVTLDDGRTGYIVTTGVMDHGTDIDPVKAAADCKRRGDPRIGMTDKQVLATCWGKPDHVNRTQTAAGVTDQYVYSNGRYVYLRNGVVTSIQATGTLR